MKKIFLCSISVFALMGVNAQAQDGNVYAGLEGYASILNTEKSIGSVLDLHTDYKTGGGFAGIVGYDFGKWRLEGEFGKHFNSAKSFTVVDDAGLGMVSGASTSGKANMTHYMVNAVVDFDSPLDDGMINPFVGGGVGLANIGLRHMKPAGTTTAYVNHSDNVLAYQAFAGIHFPVDDAIDLSLKYRFMGTTNSNMLDRTGSAFRASYDVHDVIFGISYKFGVKKPTRTARVPEPIRPAPEPVQVPDPTPVVDIAPSAPPPQPVVDKGPYSVYFEWDSAFISSASREVIRKAMVESSKIEQITIQVDGHADRSGPNGYNDNLSFERATAVKELFIANGITADKILIEGHGERNPAIQTNDGVREQQNRRVIIILE